MPQQGQYLRHLMEQPQLGELAEKGVKNWWNWRLAFNRQ